MPQVYNDPERADDPHALPDIETFYVSATEAYKNTDGDGPMEDGWY